MRIIAKKALRDFWEKHTDSEQPLKAWFQEANKAEWASFHEIQAKYSRASAVGSDRVVFRIKGNQYRLIVRINYEAGLIHIKFIGTYAEYDQINAATVNDF